MHHIIADIGAGTGFFAKLLLDHGNTVYCIEPNHAMQEKGKEYLAQYQNVHWVTGSAEATTLPEKSIDMIVAAQAFHWFDAEKTKCEWQRIVKDGGYAALVWHLRQKKTQFSQEYDNLLISSCPEYQQWGEDYFDYLAGTLFDRHAKHSSLFTQQLTCEEFIGRISSGSYAPKKGSQQYSAFFDALESLHQKYQQNGKVELAYTIVVYVGLLDDLISP